MRQVATALGMLAACALGPDDAHSQARGPSHSQTREEGLHISGRAERRELMIEQAMELAEAERIALLDPAERARRFAELEGMLRRLPDRFRIEGQIERPVQVGVAWRPAASATRTIMGNNGTFSKANYERWRRCENQ